MKKVVIALILILVPALSFAVTDAEVRNMMIKESLQSYPGPCPCPYNTMRNGRSCGSHSAYSKPGGYSPLCYPDDISDQMVQVYRTKHNMR